MADVISLVIRGLRSEDWAALYTLWHNEAILRDTTELPYPDEDSFRERFSSAPENGTVLVAEAGLPSGRKRLVGVAVLQVQARRRLHSGDLNLIVHPDFRKTDYDAALLTHAIDLAEKWLGLRRIQALIFAADTASRALYEAHGFQLEATVRQYAMRDGTLADGLLLARVCEEVS